jgi:hypothetical protein
MLKWRTPISAFQVSAFQLFSFSAFQSGRDADGVLKAELLDPGYWLLDGGRLKADSDFSFSGFSVSAFQHWPSRRRTV